MRLRCELKGMSELVAFVAAAAVALGRVLVGRWPEPRGQDFLDPKPRREL